MSVTAPLEKIPRQRQPLPENDFVTNCITLGIKKPNSVVAAMASTPAITSASVIDLSPTFIGGLGFQALTPLLSKNHALQSLNVSSNGLSNESVVFFCREFTEHPSIRILNFSTNPLTLPAGEALLHLVQRNAKIEEINLADTGIDDAIQRNIRRVLNLRKQQISSDAAGKKKVASSAPNATSTPFQRVMLEYLPKREAKREKQVAALAAQESKALADLTDMCTTKCPLLPPKDPASGWTVINVAVIAFPTIFNSELKILNDVIIAELNAKYAAQRVYFNVLDNASREAAGRGIDAAHLVVEADYLSDISKANAFVVEFVGDRLGLLAHTPAVTAAGATAAASGPIQYSLHRAAKALQPATLLISCVRRSARQMNLPAALAPIFSDEPTLVHPDALASAVKVAVAKTRGVEHKLAAFDIDVANRAWEKHSEYLKEASSEPHALTIARYDAAFDSSDMKGRVYLKGLEKLESDLRNRIAIVADAVVRSTPLVQDVGAVRSAALLQQCTEHSAVKKQLLGKLDLYTVTPPSRNVMLVVGQPGSSLSTTCGAYIQRCHKRPNYVIARHLVRNPLLSDECTDPRTVLLSLLRQLSPDQALLKSLESEIDISRIEAAFHESFSKAAAALEEGKVLVLALDSVNDIDEAVYPCESLRLSDTGIDLWKPPMEVAPPKADKTLKSNGTSDGGAPLSTTMTDSEAAKISFIPYCLPRNARIVCTATSQSAVAQRLEQRGRDSTEVIQVPELTGNEVDLIVMGEMQRLGLSVSEEDLAAVRTKLGANNVEYLSFLLDGIRALFEAPGYHSISGLISSFPQTIASCCDDILSALEANVGVATAKNACGLLLFSRWGLCDMELRELLSNSAESKKSGGKFPSSELNRICRILRPGLLQVPGGDAQGTNNLLSIIFLRSRALRAAIAARYFESPDQVVAIHTQIAHYYRRIVQQQQGSSHPLLRTALKEMPYHATSAKLWSLLEDTVFRLEYIGRCYEHGIGYALFRECIRAYNTLDARSGQVAGQEALKDKMKQYIYFIRNHSVNLVQFPHLGCQVAIGTAALSHVYQDALSFFKQHPTVPHVVIANRSTAKLHRERVCDAVFAPNGLRFATCSDDRTIRLANLFGESILHICQSASKLKLVRYSTTSRYLLAVTEDRTTFVFDATSGQLVSKASAHVATIRSAEMSVRGKFYFTGSDDRTAKVWESETGAQLATANHMQFTLASSNTGNVAQVVPHPLAEDSFFTVCDKKVTGWKLTHLRDACEQTLSIQAHHTLALANMVLAMDGAYLVTCAREPRNRGSGGGQSGLDDVRTEENIKVWATATGRHIASLGRGPTAGNSGPEYCVVAPNERRLAAALVDGGIQLYHLDWKSFSVSSTTTDATATPELIHPYLYFAGFRGLSTPTASAMQFSHDSALLVASGNVRMLKIWQVDDGVETRNTYAEYLNEHPITCLAVSSNPQEEGGTMVIGDITGRSLALRLQTAS